MSEKYLLGVEFMKQLAEILELPDNVYSVEIAAHGNDVVKMRLGLLVRESQAIGVKNLFKTYKMVDVKSSKEFALEKADSD